VRSTGSWPRVLLFAVVLLIPGRAQGRPLGLSPRLAKIESLALSGRASDFLPGVSAQVFHASTSGTTFFGGTVWAADSMRWEALENGIWTFDSGVGSSIVPPGGPGAMPSPTSTWVNPFKHSGLHATMEGWIGFDNTFNATPYFRRLTANDPRWGSTVCVGAAAGLGGNASFWAGVFPAEATALCYGGGQGYGNAWKVCIEHAFDYAGGSMTLGFDYRSETEPDFDYSTVYCDTSGAGDDVEVVSYTGSRSGKKYLSLDAGYSLPVVPKPIKIKFCVTSDGAWSDQDGLFPTSCGAFALDNIQVLGVGIHSFSDFESSDDGWVLSAPEEGLGGEWSNLFDLSGLPSPMTSCACALSESVLAFPDANNQHGNYQDNLAASPWIDLSAAGQAGTYGKMVRSSVYAELPLRNYVFAQVYAQWYPERCLRTGKLITSPWTSNGFVYDFGGNPVCTTPGKPMEADLSAVVPPAAEQLRIALGCVSYCRFFSTCTQVSNTTPWFDNVSVGVYGAPGVPFIATDELGRAQDNFPQNGGLGASSPGRIDANNIQGDVRPENGTTLGDTLVVMGGVGNAEVYVHFKVRPGPGLNLANFNAWYNKHAASPVDAAFHRARIDSAEYGGAGPISGRWMTTYHEADPNFIGNDRMTSPADISPRGGQWRLANDIFPDNLFTAGTRIDYFFTANAVGSQQYWRDPATGSYEVEILPSSFSATNSYNCTLYVDHFNRGAQPAIEAALGSVVGFGSNNVENTRWDRYDVNAAASQQASLGRPLSSDYGVSVPQLITYANVLWNSGDLNAFNLTKEDADIINPCLTLLYFDNRNYYFSGNGIVYSAIHEGASEPSARRLFEGIAGVTLQASCSSGSFASGNCPSPGSPVDQTGCVNLDPVAGAVVANNPVRSGSHVAQGNGCPDQRSFDVLTLVTPEFGLSKGDERYSSPVKSANFASVTTNAASSGTLHYRIITDGLSVHYRRDLGTPCDFALGGTNAITERIREVSTYFSMASEYACFDPAGAVGLPTQETVESKVELGIVTPNPMVAGAQGRLRFSLPRQGKVTLELFDVQGRLVKTLFDGGAKAGDNDITWDGTDSQGHRSSAGVYFCRLRALGSDISKKLIVVGKN
jgi:flagellar hook capping protein FlgD